VTLPRSGACSPVIIRKQQALAGRARTDQAEQTAFAGTIQIDVAQDWAVEALAHAFQAIQRAPWVPSLAARPGSTPALARASPRPETARPAGPNSRAGRRRRWSAKWNTEARVTVTGQEARELRVPRGAAGMGTGDGHVPIPELVAQAGHRARDQRWMSLMAIGGAGAAVAATRPTPKRARELRPATVSP
jgi:hypothetical protein